MKLIIAAKPDFTCFRRPSNPFRFKFYKLVQSKIFDYFILTIILMNILTMTMTYEGMTMQLENILKYINMVFTFVFIFECVAKLIGLGFQGYWFSGWNKFDFFVVMMSLIDLAMDLMGGEFLKALKVGP